MVDGTWIVQASVPGRADWVAWDDRRVVVGCTPDVGSARAAVVFAARLLRVLTRMEAS